jgi:acyl carrier protein
MKKEQVYEQLMDIIKDIKGDDVAVTSSTALIEGGIMDSLEIINYLTQIEEQFDVSISMDDLVDKKLGIIDNMINFIAEKK